MATITEDYVSFEIAKLLKEKGFEGHSIFTIYDENAAHAYIKELQEKHLPYCSDDPKLKEFYYTQPTLQMAMKWLREVHNIHIELNPICYGDTEEDIKWHYGWAVKTTIFTDRWKRHNAEHISYEQAAETAIKYCLENLI